MQATILSLFGVCMLSGVCELLLLQDGAQGSRRLLRFLTSLAVILLILNPLVSLFRSGDSLFSADIDVEEPSVQVYQQRFEEAVAAQCESDLTEGLYTLLEREHGLAREHCHIRVFFAQDGTLMRVQISLSGAGLLKDPDTLSAALEPLLHCTVEVR